MQDRQTRMSLAADGHLESEPTRPEPLPPTPEELLATRVLAARIKRSILRLAPGRIRQLEVNVIGHSKIVLSGDCSSYYCKQLAQHAAMQLAHDEQVDNRIQVISGMAR